MRALVGVVIIAFIAQASAQQLTCFQCDDCTNINQATTNRVQCYGPATEPTRPTNPIAPPITPPGTTTTTTTRSPGSQIDENLPQTVNTGNQAISGSRNLPLHSCIVIRRQIGDRHITHRGCGLTGRDDEHTCKANNDNIEPYACAVCSDDLCNITDGGATLLGSFLLVITAIIAVMRLN